MKSGPAIASRGPIYAINLDDYVADGRFTETAQIIMKPMHNCTEFSPGGKAIHILLAAPDFHTTVAMA